MINKYVQLCPSICVIVLCTALPLKYALLLKFLSNIFYCFLSAFGMKEASKTIDTIWIFEKPLDKIDNFEPAYEGVIVEYFHKSKVCIKREGI